MTSLIPAAKVTALLACAFMCAAIGGASLDARVALNQVQTDIKGVTDKAGLELDSLKIATDSVSSSAVQTMSEAQGTVKILNKSLKPLLDGLAPIEVAIADDVDTAGKIEHDARLSLDNVNKAAIAERQYFEKSLPDLMESVKADVVDAGDTLTAAKTLIADENLKHLIANSADITEHTAHMTEMGDEELTKLVHPTKKKVTFWGGVWAAAQVVHKLSPPLF